MKNNIIWMAVSIIFLLAVAVVRYESKEDDVPTKTDFARSGESVVVRNLAIDKETGRKFGFLHSVKKNDQNYLLEIDEVEFLSGEAAIRAGVQDTKCSRQKIADCIPSLNNDFYIRNIDKSAATYVADKNTEIQIFKNPGSPVLVKADIGALAAKFPEPRSYLSAYPFMFLSEGAVITKLEEQYIP